MKIVKGIFVLILTTVYVLKWLQWERCDFRHSTALSSKLRVHCLAPKLLLLLLLLNYYLCTFNIIKEDTHGILSCYILVHPVLVPGFAQYNLAHPKMEVDWCRFLSVSEHLLHMLHCIFPSWTSPCNHQVRLKENTTDY